VFAGGKPKQDLGSILDTSADVEIVDNFYCVQRMIATNIFRYFTGIWSIVYQK